VRDWMCVAVARSVLVNLVPTKIQHSVVQAVLPTRAGWPPVPQASPVCSHVSGADAQERGLQTELRV
jgi:hypothetical protein